MKGICIECKYVDDISAFQWKDGEEVKARTYKTRFCPRCESESIAHVHEMSSETYAALQKMIDNNENKEKP